VPLTDGDSGAEGDEEEDAGGEEQEAGADRRREGRASAAPRAIRHLT